MGPVFRAYDAERERLVAIKLFKLDLPPERGHQLVAELERLVAADLNHPAIARPVAAGMSGVSAYLAVDYVSAESLDLAVREYGPAPAGDALRVALQLAGALDFASIVHVHHGALHPRDVLLSADETRLTGLGVAQALEKIGVSVPVRRPYTALELISADASQRIAEGAKAADLFSLAAVVYELMTGKRIAGAGESAVDAIGDVAGANPAALRQVFARALAEAPRDRFATGLEFVDALRAALPQLPVISRQSPVETRQTRPLRPKTDEARQATALPFDVPEGSDRADLQLSAPEPSADLPLAAAEERRFEDAEPAIQHPSTAAEAAGADDRKYNLVTSAASASSAVEPEVFRGALERSRSAVWPLVLALFVGLAVGFAGGYSVGTGRDRTTPQTAAAPPPAGHEFTETAVKPDEPKRDDRSVPPQADQSAAPAPQARPNPDTTRTPAAPVATNIGRLLIRSTPAGARVTVDGKDAGVTPAAVRDLAPGAHRIHVSRDGYAAVERRVTITRSQPAQSLTVPLTREPRSAAVERSTPGTAGAFSGTLYIDSRPSGAKVFLDGRLIGTTPLSMASVTAGEHAVRLEYDGFRRWTSAVRVVASEQNRVTASLER